MSKTTPRLGRGLSSLISVSEIPVETSIPAPPVAAAVPEAPPGATVLDLPIDSIAPNPHQPRRSMDETALKELAESIKSTGMIQPILVRRTAEGAIQLIAGERRWRASKLAGLNTVPAIVKEVDGLTQAQMALIENIQREDLNAIDRAMGYRTLLTQLGLTQAELAGRMGEDRGTIAHFLRLLDLHAKVQEMVRDGRLGIGHAKTLAGVTNAEEQQRLANMAVVQNLSVRNLEKLIDGSAQKKPTKERSPVATSMHMANVERSMSAQLGMRVSVRTSAKSTRKGRIVIHYANLDQFDEFINRLGIKLDD